MVKRKNCSKWCKTSLIKFICFYINNFQPLLKLNSHFVEIRTGLYNEVYIENIRIVLLYLYLYNLHREKYSEDLPLSKCVTNFNDDEVSTLLATASLYKRVGMKRCHVSRVSRSTLRGSANHLVVMIVSRHDRI